MSEKRWVQHISGQGEKWEVIREHENDAAYRVRGKRLEIHPTLEHYLPKSEYRLCEPPDKWVDVTEHCEWDGVSSIYHRQNKIVCSGNFYRLRKVRVTYLERTLDTLDAQWAFIVEEMP